ncbi:Gamma-terpinene synthase chloroplastic, partial [Bienertia sinuspersici]
MSSRKQKPYGSGSSSTSKRVLRVICMRGNLAVLKTVKHGPDVGTKFYGCPLWPDTTCKTYVLIEGSNVVDELQYHLLEKDTTIMELEMLLNLKDDRIKQLQMKNNMLEDEVKELRKGCCQAP